MQTDPVTADKPSAPPWIDVYKENGLTYRYFLDWRHRVMERFGLCAGTIALVSSYFLTAKEPLTQPWPVVGFLLLILSVSSYACLFMDRKNALMLLRCEIAGRDIETKLVGSDEASKLFYTNQLSDNGPDDLTAIKAPPYNVILPWVYRLSGITALLGSLVILVKALVDTFQCH